MRTADRDRQANSPPASTGDDERSQPDRAETSNDVEGREGWLGPVRASSLTKQIRRARARMRKAETGADTGEEKAPRPRRKRASGRLPDAAALRAGFDAWFDARGWRVFDFQRDVWAHAEAGRSGLLHATTGAGKTWAAWGAALLRASLHARDTDTASLRVLWITPMRALAQDTARALTEPLAALGIDWEVGIRTGDTSSADRARQRTRLPDALVTTPESLSLLLSYPDARERLSGVAAIVVDEWHELLGNKRGVQAQLALARLRRWNPGLVVWGLSATLGDLPHALDVLVPTHATPASGPSPVIVRGEIAKPVVIDSLLPASAERFPWAGHLGLNMLGPVIAELEQSRSTLVFTNTRAQSEQWYQALLAARPDWAGLIALHHGSLDGELREWVERGLKEGSLLAVVCTSSLDLGVDFLPVERVLQIGSPKGVARLLQRAGRSGHAPGRVSRVTCVPAQGLELLEAAAARRAALAGHIEARHSPRAPLDVLVQHLVTIALGGGFRDQDLLAEVRSSHAYRELGDEDWQWALSFVVYGGAALGAYPEYHRVVVDADGEHAGIHRVADDGIARRHRLSIGTITADSAMTVSFLGGSRLGTVEESFIARLKPGDFFLFGGRLLELVRVRDMTAYVRAARANRPAVPRWQGGRMPLSSELAQSVLDLLDEVADGRDAEPETRLLRPLLDLQARWSALPGSDRFLVETLQSREGHHAFFFAFAGRQAHTGMAALFAWRIARQTPRTFSMSFNDYGFELLSDAPVDWHAAFAAGLLDTDALEADILASLNAGELARRKFREIARVAGLVFQGFPGAMKVARQLQASSGLLFDVFTRYDPDNRLLRQAQEEALAQELDMDRLRHAMQALQQRRLDIRATHHATPFAFPLMIERLRERLSTEKLADRVARMVTALEKAADRR
ncbi:ligase-associated DNA damage response DEXH box helicase [Uliginosibacterium sp. H1]|uniref:ligase-associated DNA damage response DEXH box helicase n=1 Tax=Uliginosibacterium sp. H1 TaxID=3114757 RepID=UPI002E188805|nr:ligase-associated DNA damage response DEXH box helicase [Uliginosibacterium sp. H1]